MTKNQYFRFEDFGTDSEQQVMDDLIVESIQIYGHDVYYIPRTINSEDRILNEDPASSYDSAIKTTVYIKSVYGFTGDGNYMSKLGLNLRDEVVFTIARTQFTKDVSKKIDSIRPREGDLIYFRMNEKAYQIQAVSKFEMFYPLGKLYTWEMTCELFEYSGEDFNTGIPMLDRLNLQSTDPVGSPFAVADVPESYAEKHTVPDPANREEDFLEQIQQLKNWTPDDPFSEGNGV